MLISFAAIAVGYLLGSVSTAILTCRLMGLPDPRSEGSGNPGATNVLRLGGKKAAAVTLAGDVLKGVLPVLVARLLGLDGWTLAAVAVAAFLGHLYPVFFSFRGGKGVATAAGAMLALAPLVAAVCLATWLLVAKLFKISSMAALSAAVLAPVYGWALHQSTSTVLALTIMGVLLVWRHRSNIARILDGSESRIGARKGPVAEDTSPGSGDGG